MHSLLYKLSNLKVSSALIIVISLLISFSVSASGQFNTQKRYLYVQPGQSIFSIVKVLYAEQQDQWPVIIKEIVRKNPHAFIGADATKIQVGERLEIPAFVSNITPVVSPQAVVFKGSGSVGQVIKSYGRTFAISNKGKNRQLDVGSEVFVGDRIFTGVKGYIRLSMIDDAKIDLRCNSEMVIEDYQLLRGGNRSVIYLIKGSVKKITGSIGKLADDVYEMRTPLATVGVRGTEYAIRVLQSHGCDGSLDVNSNGLFVKVNKGGIDVKLKTEDFALNTGDTALLADADSQLKSIEAREGVFDQAVEGEGKSYFFGSVFWMIVFIPLVLMLRRQQKHGS